MKQRFAEIVIQYKDVAHRVYPESAGLWRRPTVW